MNRAWMLTIASLVLFAAPARADLEITEVAPGLYRGRVPKTEADFAELHRRCIRTVLDIRGNTPRASARERRRVEEHCPTYMNVPISFFPLRDGSGDRVVAAMANPANYPMYVHCQVNRDRTSAAVAAFRVRVQGVDVQTAEEEAHAFGIRRYFIGLIRFIRMADWE
jgi:protein tyrosine/serine phosphatase